MQDEPRPEEILAAIAAFLRDEVVPALPPELGFQARVAANAVALVQRQLALAPAAEAAERQRLAALLGCDDSLAALNAALAGRLREGAAAAVLADPAGPLARHLWQTILDKLAVDQPGYAAYRRAAAAPPEAAPVASAPIASPPIAFPPIDTPSSET